MPTATTATISGIFKEVYGPKIESSLPDEVTALRRIETKAMELDSGGKYITFPIKVSRNSGVGFRLEGETLPVAGTQGYKNVQIPLKYQYGSIRLTGQVLKLANTNPRAFADGLDSEMMGLKDDIVKDTARIVYGDGTGLMATVTTAAGPVNTFTVNWFMYLNEGDQVDISTVGTGAPIATARTITSIVPTGIGLTANVTIDGAPINVTVTSGIFRAGNFTGGVVREALGFGRIVNNTGGAFQNIDNSLPGNSRWASTVLANGGTNRALSEGLMINAMDNIRLASNQRPSVIFTSLGVRRAYFNLLTQQRRYNDTKTYEGGFMALPFNCGKEIPVVDDADATPNTMYFLTEDKLKVVQNTPIEWIDEQGEPLQKLPNVDIFQAEVRRFFEFATTQRNAHGVIRDITEG